MKTLVMVLVVALAIAPLLILGCKTESTGPPPPRNPREYAWTIDTLAYPGSLQTLMRYSWGSSSSNIYICGFNERGFGRMYHWNGQSWTNVKLLVTEGGPLTRVGTFSSILGFSEQAVYAAGYVDIENTPFLARFDGAQWSEINVSGGRGLQSLWGRSPTDFWIGGMEGYLAHYNGSQFDRDSVSYTFVNDTTQNPQITQIIGDASVTYLVLGNAPDTLFLPIFYFYKRLGSQWVLRDSSYDFARLFISPSGILYRYGPGGIQRQSGTTWNTVLSQLAAVGMGASTENNIFAVGYESNGRVYHYNGSDWFEFTQLRMQNVRFQSVWTDGKEAFVIGITSDFPMKTVVLHGR